VTLYTRCMIILQCAFYIHRINRDDSLQQWRWHIYYKHTRYYTWKHGWGGGYRSRYDNMVRLLYSVVGTIYSYEGGSRLRSCIKLISLGVGRGKFQSNLPKCFDMTTIGGI